MIPIWLQNLLARLRAVQISKDALRRPIFLWVSVGALLICVCYYLTLGAPWSFPGGTLLKVSRGSTLSQVAETLHERGYIHSVTVFKFVAWMLGKDTEIIAGEYSFSRPQNTFTLVMRLTSGEYDLLPIKITIPEGVSVREVTQIIKEKLPDFEANAFYTLALPKEGRLFPDTYFFLPGEDPDLILSAFLNNFDEHMRDISLALRISEFGKPFDEVLAMASLLEEEAGDTQNRRIISGILWKRMMLGMPLQVDAVFLYILGKNTFQLTKNDLQADSSYNTYTNKGLPPGPITNPGVDSILAAVTPITTKYLYYLSDYSGNLYYAATYEQHLANKRKYIKN